MNASTWIVVPAFNEAAAIGDVVRGLRAIYPNVVVIDDGSRDATAGVARSAGAVVLRHAVNRGQGAALQTGIDYALSRGASIVVTFDSDGQHVVADVAKLTEPIEGGRADAVLGSRFRGSTENMPFMRRVMLRAAVAFTRFTSGARVTDAHNGMRAFSRAAASKIEIRLDRMAHASEIIDQIARSGIRYEEVPVHVRYTEYSRRKGQSSAHAFRILYDYLLGRWLR